MSGVDYSHTFPALFSEMYWDWGPITAQFRMTTELPPADVLIKVRVVPFVGDDVVILKMADGNWDHPVGTLEPGETYLEALARESMEEAGALISNFSAFGVLDCFNHNPQPYRPHYPHPNFTQLIGFGNAKIVSDPKPAPEGEYEVVQQVDIVNLDEAVNRLRARSDGHWQADMYRLAAELRSELE
jgi:8-oxo-dGTP pyrophosphatase MutT (NUDIX family)